MNFMPFDPGAELRPLSQRIEERRAQAAVRRAALGSHRCTTFVLQGSLQIDAITCLCCGMTSRNPWDVVERYCGFCHEYHQVLGAASA